MQILCIQIIYEMANSRRRDSFFISINNIAEIIHLIYFVVMQIHQKVLREFIIFIAMMGILFWIQFKI